jgi:gluconate 2-dehydrogenase gamma chain
VPWALTDGERAVLDAVTSRLVPSDETGPGAREARVVRYLERALATEYRADRGVYTEGLKALDLAARSRGGEGFVALDPERQDELLEELERGADPFFELVRRHTLEGMFGDPSWGGNEGGVGWTLLRYPGPRHVWSEADQLLDVEPRPPGER